MNCPACGVQHEKDLIINIEKNVRLIVYYFPCGAKLEIKNIDGEWSQEQTKNCTWSKVRNN